MLAALRASFSRENVGRYLAHPPSILDRIVGDPSAGKVLYTGKAIHPRHRANFRVFDPLAFLAEICAPTSPIPMRRPRSITAGVTASPVRAIPLDFACRR
jgi:hypothetical protein